MIRRTLRSGSAQNCVSLMIIKCSTPEAFRGTASKKFTMVSGYLAHIEQHFVKNDKAETSTLLANLISIKYKGVHHACLIMLQN